MPRSVRAFVCAFLSTVSLFAAAPQVVVTDAPNGMGQETGGAFATDSLTVLNAGPGNTNVSISQKGSFFTVSPSSFALAEGESRTVTIQSTTQSGGVADGSINILSDGVTQPITIPIRLFVASKPAGLVSPVPGAAVFVSGLSDSLHPGQISVSNRGNVGMQGILVPDSQWIVPQTNVIGIPSNGNSPGPFVVDPSRRPDNGSPLGTLVGNLALVYINGTANTLTNESTIAAAPASSRVNVSIVDISKPPVAPGQPSPLNPNEIAFFLPGISNLGAQSTDLFISNRTTTSIPDVKLYYTPANGSPSSALLASVSQLAAGVNAWFPTAQQVLFNAFNQSGTLQLRNPAAANVSLTAMQLITPDPVNTYRTFVPLLRSDRASVTRIFSGVEKTATRQTDITIQETSGNAATVTLDFLDANGATVGAPNTQALQPFGLLSLPNVVPAGAIAARATAGGAGKIDGYATVQDGFTLDTFVITDPRANSGDDVFVAPIPKGGGSVDVFVTGPASVAVVGKEKRRRAAGVQSTGGREANTLAGPNATQRYTFATTTPGYIRVAGTSDAFTASARLTLSRAGVQGFFGSAIPLRRPLDGASSGVSRRVSGVDDLLNGPHPSLMLIETGGAAVNVKVTVTFTFSSGLTTNTQITSAKDFSISAGQMLTVDDVIGTVVGASRPSFGDLRRAIIDVSVTGGSGRVLPFVSITDKVSGDVTILTD